MQPQRLLRFRMPMMVGEDVRAAQRGLLMTLSDPKPFTSADGVFGDATRRGVIKFQQHAGLEEDGVVGDATWAALFDDDAVASGAPAARPPQVPQAPPGFGAPRAHPPVPGRPLGPHSTQEVALWLFEHFGTEIRRMVQEAVAEGVATRPALDAATIAAIAAKETGVIFLPWTRNVALAPKEVLRLCIGDASGDVPNTSRSAFPVNRAAFERALGSDLSRRLVAAANAMRVKRTPPLKPANVLYKGYGMFQIDLQFSQPGRADQDLPFFADQLWADMGECLARVRGELVAKHKAALRAGIPAPVPLREVVRRYNGGGRRAETYADHVMDMRDDCLTVST